MSTYNYYISFQNNTSTPVASVSINHMEVNGSGSISGNSVYQWALYSIPANSSTYTTPGTFVEASSQYNEWSITITDQNNNAFGCFVHSGVSASNSGTVAVTLGYSSPNYTVTINDGHGSNNTFSLGALATTYGF